MDLCVANSNSGGSRGLKEAVAVSAPVIRIEARSRRRSCTAPLSRREPGQSGVTAIPVVIRLVGFQLELEIALAPKQCPVEKLSPYCPYQSLNESMRAGRAGNGFDLVDLEYPKVRQPAMKPELRIVVRGKMLGQSLPCDRAIEHPADLDTPAPNDEYFDHTT